MKRSFIGFGLAGLLGLGVALTAACSSSTTNNPATPSGTGCNQSVAGVQVCYVYTNVSASQASSITSACTQGGGTAVSSCPSANLAGTCSYAQTGYNIAASYYCPTSTSALQSACTGAQSGTWVAGSACSAGDAGGGGEDSGNGGGGDADTNG
jgi:hypothetical protein